MFSKSTWICRASRRLSGWIGNATRLPRNSVESAIMSATAFYLPAPLIFAALALDGLAGDPPWLPHPVVLIRRAISWGEHRLRKVQPRTDFLNGLVLAVCVTTLAGGAAWVTIVLCGLASHRPSSLAAVLVAWTTLAMRGLDDAAKTVELVWAAMMSARPVARCQPWLAAIPTSLIGPD